MFEEARAAEAAGDYHTAFALFAEANRVRRAALPVRPEEIEARHIQVIETMASVFTADFLREHAGQGHPSTAPIFIVGLPRSGSTLLEQIIATHPEGQGMGETRILADTLNGHFPYPVTAPRGPGHFRRRSAAYLDAMRAAGWKNRRRFVDKNLLNDVAIGAIHLMFPRAVIIESVRDPMDACLSAFRTDFAAGNEWTCDLGDLGRYYQRRRRTMEHWAAVLPGRVIQVSHEALVADPEPQIRRLVAACGLPWDDRCLRFHETRREVRTASAWQVTQPIFQTSVGRWRRYEGFLGPLAEAMGLDLPA